MNNYCLYTIQVAVGFEYEGKTEKHESQKGLKYVVFVYKYVTLLTIITKRLILKYFYNSVPMVFKQAGTKLGVDHFIYLLTSL